MKEKKKKKFHFTFHPPCSTQVARAFFFRAHFRISNRVFVLASPIDNAYNMPQRQVCEICKRSVLNARLLGPLIHTRTITAHYNCVLFIPVTPHSTSRRHNETDDAIAGVSTRFIRDEGARAKLLVSEIIFIGIHLLPFSFFPPIYFIVNFLLLTRIRCAIFANQKAQVPAVVEISAQILLCVFAKKSTTLIVV